MSLYDNIDEDDALKLHCGTASAAEQCRILGIEVGDTIEGREESGRYWNEAKLTLLWVGEEIAVWRVTERGSNHAEWSAPEESAEWSLEWRHWTKVLPNTAGKRRA